MEPSVTPPQVSTPPPASVRTLGIVLSVQAACYAVAGIVATISLVIRGPDTLHLGAYATYRTHPITMLTVGLGAGGLLFWLARRIPDRPMGLHRAIWITEAVLLVDAVIAFLFGVFNLWWLVGLLAAVAALWLLRTEDTVRYLD